MKKVISIMICFLFLFTTIPTAFAEEAIPSDSPSATLTESASPSASPSAEPSASESASPSASSSESAPPSPSPSESASPSASQRVSPSPSESASPSDNASPSPSPSESASPSNNASSSPSLEPLLSEMSLSTWNEYTYDLSPDSTYAIITKYNGSSTVITLPSQINSTPVKQIGANAFAACTSLASVTIPSGYTSIGDYAFDGCTALSTVSFPNTLQTIGGYAFQGCIHLTSANLPDSLTGIGNDAFKQCSALTSVTIPGSVTNPSVGIFYECTGLITVIIQNGVYVIDDSLFKDCTNLKTVSVPNSVTSWGSGPFSGCPDVVLYGTVGSSAENYAGTNNIPFIKFDTGTGTITGFEGNPTNVFLPTSVNGVSVSKIADSAFSSSGISSIFIPASVTSIGTDAFYMCILAQINVDASNPNYSSLNGVLFDKSKTILISYPTQKTDATYTIPDGVVTVKAHAFYGGLTSVTIPGSVTTIQKSAFDCNITGFQVDSSNTYYCSQNGVLFNKDMSVLVIYPWGNTAASYTIPNSVKKIADEAFINCRLSSVTIPDGLTQIGESAFENSENFTSITIPSSITSIGKDAFASDYNQTLCYAYFKGNNYSFDSSIFDGTLPFFTVYYDDAATGWSTPAWNGYKCYPYSQYKQQDFHYQYYGSEIAITKYVGTDTEVTIPDTIDGKPVTQIWGIDNTNLKVLNIPAGIQTIEWQCLSGCTGFTTINVDPANSNYSSVDGILYDKAQTDLIQYPASKAGTSFTVPGTVITVGDASFASAANLTTVILPASVQGISWFAFSDSSITNITIPPTVSSIADSAFYNCASLTQINVDASNQNYSSQNGVLFNKTKSILEIYPIGNANNSYIVPNGVTMIASQAFSYSKFSNVMLPNTLVTLAGFDHCSNLASVIIPSSVQTIGQGTFANCGNLQKAYFMGNAYPEFPTEIFQSHLDAVPANLTIYYDPATTGWTTPTWNGYKCYPMINNGYDVNDFTRLQAFLNQPSPTAGKTNGQMLNPGYDPNDPTTWGDNYGYAIKWNTDNPKRVTKMILPAGSNEDLAGSADFSNFTKLTSLDIGYSITQLNINGDTALTYLQCADTAVTSLDVSTDTALQDFSCAGSPISTLDVSKNLALTSLNCGYTNISSLDLSNNTNLQELDCESDYFTTLDLSKNTLLTDLWCANNYLTDIKASIGGKSIQLHANGNGYVELRRATDMGMGVKETEFTATALPNNGYTFQNWMQNGTVVSTSQVFNLQDNTDYDLTANYILDSAGYNDHDFKAIQAFLNKPSDTAGKINGQTLNVHYNQNDPTTWTGVTWNTDTPKRVIKVDWDSVVWMKGNLDLSDFSKIVTIDTRLMEITQLNVSGDTALTYFDCDNDMLTSLDVSTNTALQYLDCYANSISSLDVSKNTALTTLYCDYCNLASLNVSANTALTTLYCSDNQLSTLDLSKNTLLTSLDCSYNQLTSLDLSHCGSFTWLSTGSNKLTDIRATIGGKSIRLRANGNAYVELTYSYSALQVNTVPSGTAQFLNWTQNGSMVSINQEFTLQGNTSYDLIANYMTQYTVTFNNQGGSSATSILNVNYGSTISKPTDPTKTGYRFSGWYQDSGYKTAWNFSTDTVTGDTTLYAKWTPTDPISAFVTRFYEQCLSREPDPTGLNNWVTALKAGQLTGADTAKGFVFSDEFKSKNLSNSDFVGVMYNAFFGGLDPTGQAAWANLLDMGFSRYYVMAGFLNSDQFKALCSSYGISVGSLQMTDPADKYPNTTSFVARFYELCLGRGGDPTGLNSWVNALQTGQGSGSDVAYGFVFSNEFVSRNVSNADFVTIMYKAFFNRDPDPSGYNAWVSMLNSGTSRLHVLAGFVGSQEFISLCSSYGIKPGYLKS